MSALRTRFTDQMKEYMRAKDETGLATVRLISAALKDKDIDARGKGRPDGINEPEIMSMLQGMIKQRQESAKIYADNNRPELAAKEEAEIVVISQFLPKQLSDDEARATIKALVTEVGAADIKDMGKVMGALKDRYAGQIDMTKAGGWVKEALA
jgi:uncharacterized protein YqeY